MLISCSSFLYCTHGMASGELSSIIITDLLSCSPLCPLFRSCVFTFLCCLPPSQLHLAGLFLTYDLRHVLHISSGSGSGFSCESCSAEVAFTSALQCLSFGFFLRRGSAPYVVFLVTVGFPFFTNMDFLNWQISMTSPSSAGTDGLKVAAMLPRFVLRRSRASLFWHK